MKSIEQFHHYLPVDLLRDRVYLDVEATKSLVPLEVTLIDSNGDIMFNSLIKPDDNFLKYNPNSKIHVGISDNELSNAKHTWIDANAIIKNMLRGRIVWAYNLDYDRNFFTCKLTSAFNSYCAKERFSYFHGEYQLRWRGSYLNNKPKWQSLEEAAYILGINDLPQTHRSLDDARLLRKVVLELDKIEIHRRCGVTTTSFSKGIQNNKNNVVNLQSY